MGKSESTPSALWTIMPVMPIMAARPLLRSALSLNFFTSGSSYLGSGQTDQLRAACRPVQSSSAWQRGLALLRVLHHETVPPHTVGQGWREAEPQANQQAGGMERGTAGAQTGRRLSVGQVSAGKRPVESVPLGAPTASWHIDV